MLYFPPEVSNIQNICALRFEGWEYINNFIGEDRLVEVLNDFKKTLVILPRELDNFALYFALQRYLGKWGGERLTKYAQEHYAFDFLFLHLYRLPTPEGFINGHYEKEWNEFLFSEREKVSGIIRRSFIRRGRGKKVAI